MKGFTSGCTEQPGGVIKSAPKSFLQPQICICQAEEWWPHQQHFQAQWARGFLTVQEFPGFPWDSDQPCACFVLFIPVLVMAPRLPGSRRSLDRAGFWGVWAGPGTAVDDSCRFLLAQEILGFPGILWRENFDCLTAVPSSVALMAQQSLMGTFL